MPVREIIGQSLPVSLQLGGMGFILAVGLGVPMGLVAALYKNRGLDHLAMLVALIALALPAFIVGPLLIFVFSLWLGWFPIGGWFRPATYVLPALCLSLPYAATIARLMRNSLLDVMNQDFIRTARAKGLSPLEVTYGHALKAALLPVVTFLGPLAANLLTGSVVVETVFGIPGSGPYFVRAIENRDLYLLLGLVVIYCTLLVVMNFLVDLAYSFLDRRIKLL
jgi:oligopeptide transport system permease protein